MNRSIYQSYMEEQADEHVKEDVKEKKAYFKENFILRDELQIKYIRPILSTQAGRDALTDFVGSFIDTHSSKLYTAGPIYSYVFAEKETSFLYGLFKLPEEEKTILTLFDRVIEETYFGKLSKFLIGFCRNAPHKLLITSIIAEGLQEKHDDVVTCGIYLLGLCEYPIVYRKYWEYGVQPDIMNYTIEHLGNKFKAKRFNTLLALLTYDAGVAVDLYKPLLTSGQDHAHINIIYKLRTTMNDTFKNINNEYRKNHTDNATQHAKSSKNDDGSLNNPEGHNTNISSTIDTVCGKFASSRLDSTIVAMVAEWTQGNTENITRYLNQIFSTKNNRLDKFVENVIVSYFTADPSATSVGSGNFIKYGLSLYKTIGISKQLMYKELRDILNLWMFDIIDIRSDYSREGTIIVYSKAVFYYMIMMINRYGK